MIIFNKEIKKALKKSYNKGVASCKNDMELKYSLSLQNLESAKNLEIEQLKNDLDSAESRTAFMKTEYDYMLKNQEKVKIAGKQNERIANDLFFIVNEQVKLGENIISKIGIIKREAENNMIEDKK